MPDDDASQQPESQDVPPPPKKRPGVTFQIDEESSKSQTPLEAAPLSPVKRRHQVPVSWTSAKFLFLVMIVLKGFVRLFALSYELARVVGMREPELERFPMMEEAMWAPFRTEMMRHLVCRMFHLLLDDGLLFAVIYKDLVYVAWYGMYTLVVRVLGEQHATKRWFEMAKSALFLQLVLLAWLLKEYALGAVMAMLHLGMAHRHLMWPHQHYGPMALVLVEIAGLALLAAWEWLGDRRFFSLGMALTIFVGNVVGHFLAPLPLLLKLRFGPGLEVLEPGSHLHDILAGLGRMCHYPMTNFYIRFGTATWGLRSLGHRTLSAVIIDNRALELLEYYAPMVRSAFPETSGPDDVDQMILAAAAHEVGHAMTGQMLWYDVLGYGLLAAGLAWFVLEQVLKRPLLFRSFGFRLWPIPPACALLLVTLFLATGWQLLLLPMANLVDWMREFEADSYAASLGFATSLQKYLYVKQAAQTSLTRAFTLLHALYEHRHPPYYWRTQALN